MKPQHTDFIAEKMAEKDRERVAGESNEECMLVKMGE